MAVYLLSYHAYRSWPADHPRGYVKGGKNHSPDPDQAAFYERQAKHEPVVFTPDRQMLLLSGVLDVSERRDWRIHAFGAEPTHIHVLISWKTFTPWQDVRDKLANLLSGFLGRHAGETGRRWLTRKPSRKRVRDRKHYDYLVNVYLPKHSGLFWREGEQRPPSLDELIGDE